jgi:hypothetical protein
MKKTPLSGSRLDEMPLVVESGFILAGEKWWL